MTITTMLDRYIVHADAETGEWLEEPQSVGARVLASEWHAKTDTEGAHYDTYEHAGVTRAITVIWVL